MNSAIAQRFESEGVDSSRLDITLLFIENMVDYPLGGQFISNKVGFLAHIILMEGYDFYGFLFLFALVFIFFFMVKRMIYLHNLKNKQPVMNIFLSMYIVVIIQLMLEPAIGGYPILIWSLFIIDGLAFSYLTDYKNVNII